jgi:hypothetical protein
MTHPKEVEGWSGSLKDLARSVGKMRYDAIVEFLDCLYMEFRDQAENDRRAGRNKLSVELLKASIKLFEAGNIIQEAWKISKPFMKIEDKSQGKTAIEVEIENFCTTTKEQVWERAEASAQQVLGVSATEAFQQLALGKLHGKMIEVELELCKHLLKEDLYKYLNINKQEYENLSKNNDEELNKRLEKIQQDEENNI